MIKYLLSIMKYTKDTNTLGTNYTLLNKLNNSL